MRAPRQQRIRATHRQQQAVAAQARHGGGTSFPPMDMLVYDDSDDEGHDDVDVDESRSSTSDDSETDARGSLRDFVIDILIHYFFSPFPHLAVWHGAINPREPLALALKWTATAGKGPGLLIVPAGH